jgi:hypothetical protein
MDEHGFYLCDILRKIGKTTPSSELKFIDAMFRKADHAGGVVLRDLTNPPKRQSGLPRGAAADVNQHEERAENQNRLRNEIKIKIHELSQMDWTYRAAKGLRKWKKTQQEIFELRRELSAAEEGVTGEPQTGALPDFVVIGAAKSGTTSFYHLLVQHPLVDRAASKELRFFDHLFDEGVEWYRRCFARPRLKDGRRTITGEATPYYLFYPHAPKRMAEVVPQARLIALLRNPVDRAYSHHHMMVRRGYETLGFEEAIEAEEERLRDERNKMLEDEYYVSVEHQHFSYLSRGVYVEQLSPWSEFFRKDQILVLKSEAFFERPAETFRLVFDFLGLPDWEPKTWNVRKKGDKYQQKMDPATRERLEEYFEPHNKRLYDFLGKDFGW